MCHNMQYITIRNIEYRTMLRIDFHLRVEFLDADGLIRLQRINRLLCIIVYYRLV